MTGFRSAGVLTLGLTLLGPADLVQVPFSPATAEWRFDRPIILRFTTRKQPI